jgi:hypothetical protein
MTYARDVVRALVLLCLACTGGPPRAQRMCIEATQMCTSDAQCCPGLSCEPWLGGTSLCVYAGPMLPDGGVDSGPDAYVPPPPCILGTQECSGGTCCSPYHCGMTETSAKTMSVVCCSDLGEGCLDERGRDCCGVNMCYHNQCEPCHTTGQACDTSWHCCSGYTCNGTSCQP